jgi:hypothetical protein
MFGSKIWTYENEGEIEGILEVYEYVGAMWPQEQKTVGLKRAIIAEFRGIGTRSKPLKMMQSSRILEGQQ